MTVVSGGVRRQAAFLTVWVVIGAGMVLVGTSYWRRGLLTIALAALLAALLRLLLPARLAGWLAVRSRAVDLICYAGAGTALALLTVLVPG